MDTYVLTVSATEHNWELKIETIFTAESETELTRMEAQRKITNYANKHYFGGVRVCVLGVCRVWQYFHIGHAVLVCAV